jgi:uncharacterized protein (DUF4213/DUF364 family)
LKSRDTVLLIHVKAEFPLRRHDDTKAREIMPAVDAVIVAAIAAAFVVFAGVLAWAEHQTRNLPQVRSAGKPAGQSAPQR